MCSVVTLPGRGCCAGCGARRCAGSGAESDLQGLGALVLFNLALRRLSPRPGKRQHTIHPEILKASTHSTPSDPRSVNAQLRGTSRIRNSPLLGPFSRTMSRAIWRPQGGGVFLMSEAPQYMLYSRRHPARVKAQYRPCYQIHPACVNAQYMCAFLCPDLSPYPLPSGEGTP